MRRGEEILMYLLGLFSTWQILQFAGFSLSTWLTVLTAGYLVLTRGFSHFRRDWLLTAMLLSVVATFGISMTAAIPAGYVKASISGTAQWIFIFIICVYMRRSNDDRCTSSFFRGLDLSCKVQIIWCLLQIVCNYTLHQNLNALVFSSLLSDPSTQLTSTVTGLHWHVANMTPILVYLYFRQRSLVWKVLCLIVVFFTQSTTAIIGILLCVFFSVLVFCKRILRSSDHTIAYKTVSVILAGIFGAIVISPLLIPKAWGVISYLLERLYQIAHPSPGHESSAVHFNYYRFLPDILSQLPAHQILAGSGIGTSGYRFTQFLYQFPDAIWIVESDPVNLILSQGILGCLLHYLFIGFTAWRLVRRGHSNLACALAVLVVCGFAYNNQFLWVQLVEFMLYCSVLYPNSSNKKEL